MTAEYVPAVDHNGDEMWYDPDHDRIHEAPPGEGVPDGWRRLYVQSEPAPFEHSDMCEDSRNVSHLRDSVSGPACRCACPKCSDGHGFCICPQCSRPASHAHRPVTS